MSERNTLRSVALTMAATLVLAIAFLSAGAASAVAAAPENTAAPTISPNSPVVTGITETATTGTWTGSPTKYAYAWYRCAGSESCTSIPAATSSTYVPAAADVGKTLRVIVTATNAEGAGSAISSTTATARAAFTYFWNVCKKSEKGECLGEWTKLAEASPVSFTMASTTSIKFNANILTPFTMTCAGQSASGSLENPSGKKAGKATTSSFKLTGCSVVSPPECKIPSTIAFNALTATAVEFAYGPAVKFEPLAGTGASLFTLPITECPLEVTVVFKGNLVGIDNPKTSSLEFTKASTAGFTVGGDSASLEFTSQLQTAAGEALKVAQ